MNILIVDDKIQFAEVLRSVLESEGYEIVDIASSAEEALDKFRADPFDLVITDLRMPGMDGIKLLSELKRRASGVDVILMTAYADVETARDALKKGAVDYLVKPFDNDELTRLVAQSRLRSGFAAVREKGIMMFQGMIGDSPAMQRVYDSIRKAAATDRSLVILGESGTGKELVARAVHNLSVRHNNKFVAIHCGAIPEALLESELFGHEGGAITETNAAKDGRVQSADGGTLFLDEIAEMPMALQPKLLRFLQEYQFFRVGGNDAITVDVRVVASTNRNLEEEMNIARFREDLFYRLDVMRIDVPALRERKEDIPLLVEHFLLQAGCTSKILTKEVWRALKSYSWPGNVRELQNVIELLVIESDGSPVGCWALPERLRDPLPDETVNLDLKENEVRVIENALHRASGNKAKAARLLGISRRRLYSRMKLLDLEL